MVLDAVAFDDAIPPATRRVLFGLLFMSPAEEEGAGMLLQLLLPLFIPAAGCSDEDTAICLPGEAEKERRMILT